MNVDFWKDKRVLVTGHTGFKGGWLLCALGMLGARGFGFSSDIKPSPSAYDVWAKNYRNEGSECLGDIADLGALQTFMDESDPEIIIHMAAQSLVLQSYDDPIETIRTNVMGTANLLEAARSQKNLKAIIIVTTDKVYKIQDEPKSFTEDDELGGKDLYSSSKSACELITESYRKCFFEDGNTARIASARAGNVIGGGDWAENRIIPDLMRAQNAGETCTIRNPGATRPWQHVLEPLSGYMLLAEKLAGSDEYSGAWNFGPNDENINTVQDLTEKIVAFYNDLSVHFESSGENAHLETGFLTIDSAKAKSKLGWAPNLNFDETVQYTCEWYRAKNDADRKAITEQQTSKFFNL